MSTRSRSRVAAWLVLAGVLAFVVLYAVALRLYPGGTWLDRNEPASFWKNFLCDLEWEIALDGRPNPVGSRVMKLGMIVLSAAFAPLWLVLPRLFVRGEGGTVGRAVQTTGVISAIGTLAVPLTPSDRFGAWHSLAVVVAGISGLFAAVLAVVGLRRHEAQPLLAARIGIAMLVTAAFDLALYVRLVVTAGDVPLVLPVVQKIALLFTLAFMTTVALSVLRDRRT
jgi:uncharacterized membrane protein (DUF441 family)